MSAARAKHATPAAPAVPEVSGDHRLLLAGAYRAGLILAWKRDVERGYRLTVAGPREEYVEVAKLPRYLDTLKAAQSQIGSAG